MCLLLQTYTRCPPPWIKLNNVVGAILNFLSPKISSQIFFKLSIYFIIINANKNNPIFTKKISRNFSREYIIESQSE